MIDSRHYLEVRYHERRIVEGGFQEIERLEVAPPEYSSLSHALRAAEDLCSKSDRKVTIIVREKQSRIGKVSYEADGRGKWIRTATMV